MINQLKLKPNLQIAVLATAAALASISPGVAKATDNYAFYMIPSADALNCLPKAKARVTISPLGPIENMHIEVTGLPPKTNFDLFNIQVPNKPFGLSWYQGDIETDRYGNGVGDFTGRFNIETFIVAPGVAKAPFVHDNAPNADATTNPVTGPVHTFHLGLWFNSPQDAKKAGCLDKVTPFNGEHNAGIQVLNTGYFLDEKGPLRNVKP